MKLKNIEMKLSSITFGNVNMPMYEVMKLFYTNGKVNTTNVMLAGGIIIIGMISKMINKWLGQLSPFHFRENYMTYYEKNTG